MADLFEALYTKLGGTSAITAIVGTNPKRIFPEAIPQGQAMPAICIREISDRPTSYINGMSGHGIATVEIGCAATSVDGARDLRAAVHTALDKYRGTSASLKIRDCVPVSDSMETESPNNGGDSWRYIAVAEYDIGYQT